MVKGGRVRISSKIKLLRIWIVKARWQHDRSPRILITGCGRSGTNYVAKLLNSTGLPFSHEGFPKKGLAAWPLAVKHDDEMPWMLFKQGDITFTPILHQVRHPLAVIASTQTFAKSSWNYITKYIPLHDDDSLLLKCMKYWYYWNLEAEKISEWTYRLESFPDLFPKFCERIGHPELIQKKDMIHKMRRDVNSRAGRAGKDSSLLPRKEVTWSRLDGEDKELCGLIRLLAEKYGYTD